MAFAPMLERLEGRVLPATRTWTGAGPDANWSDAANWQGGISPSAGDSLIFPVDAASVVSHNDLPAGTLIHSIDFTAESSGSAPDYKLDGNALILEAGINFRAGGQSSFPVPDVNFDNIVLGANQTFAKSPFSNGLYKVHSPIDLQGFTLTLASPGFSTSPPELDGPISGSGGIVKAGQGNWALSGNNSYTGQTIVSAGDLGIFSTTGLGSISGSTVVMAGATLDTFAGSPEPVILDGGTLYGGNSAVAQPISLAADSTLRSAGLGGTANLNGFSLTFDGVITGTVNGPGSVIATAAALNNGTLSGTGTINAMLSVNGGLLSPGANPGPGVLHIGSATLHPGTVFRAELDSTAPGTGYSQLMASGPVDLDGSTLLVQLNFTPADSTTFSSPLKKDLFQTLR